MLEEREVEADLEARFCRVMEALGGVVRKVQWVGRRGANDRAVLFPGARIYFAELKNGKAGRVEPLQAREVRMLQGLGFVSRVIRCDADIEAFVKEIGCA